MTDVSAGVKCGARVWLLVSERTGETRQQRVIAAALGERYAELHIVGDELLDERASHRDRPGRRWRLPSARAWLPQSG